MDRPNITKILMIFTVSILLLSSLSFSGCLDEDEGGIVGIPEGEDPDGTIHDDHVNASVPIMNTYDEPKQIVMKFEIGTEEGGRYSEMKFITLPENSVEVYYQVIEIPESETPSFVDTEIIVGYDEIKVIEVDGETSEGFAQVNATIANTKFDSERILVEFIATTEDEVYSQKEGIDVSQSSVDVYTADIEDVPPNVVDFDAQIIG